MVSFGTCFGKITKSNKFKLHITALDFIAPYAKYKIWLKPNAEQQFLYGNHVLKSGIARITENTPQYEGVVIYNMQDVPLVSKFLKSIFYLLNLNKNLKLNLKN